MTAGDGIRNLGPWRVKHRDEPQEAEFALRVVALRGGVHNFGELAVRDCENSQTFARHRRSSAA